MTVLLTFFGISYIVTWSLWFAAGSIPDGGPRTLLFLLGTFAPGFLALGLTGREAGRGGVAALLKRLVDWEVPARWYVFALGYIAVVGTGVLPRKG